MKRLLTIVTLAALVALAGITDHGRDSLPAARE